MFPKLDATSGSDQGDSSVYTSTQVPKTPEYFADFSHFTDEGASVVASAIVSEVLKTAPSTSVASD